MKKSFAMDWALIQQTKKGMLRFPTENKTKKSKITSKQYQQHKKYFLFPFQ